VPKSSPPGAAVRFGCVSSRNRPSSELIGAFTFAIPFSAPVKWEIKPPPSGGKQPHVGVLLTPPVAEKMSIEPGTSVRETKTGDSAGAESSTEAVEPEGIPASQGSEVPGTFMLAALATAASMRESSVERVDDKGKSSSELIYAVSTVRFQYNNDLCYFIPGKRGKVPPQVLMTKPSARCRVIMKMEEISRPWASPAVASTEAI